MALKQKKLLIVSTVKSTTKFNTFNSLTLYSLIGVTVVSFQEKMHFFAKKTF